MLNPSDFIWTLFSSPNIPTISQTTPKIFNSENGGGSSLEDSQGTEHKYWSQYLFIYLLSVILMMDATHPVTQIYQERFFSILRLFGFSKYPK